LGFKKNGATGRERKNIRILLKGPLKRLWGEGKVRSIWRIKLSLLLTDYQTKNKLAATGWDAIGCVVLKAGAREERKKTLALLNGGKRGSLLRA